MPQNWFNRKGAHAATPHQPKTCMVTLRLNEAEYTQLLQRARQAGAASTSEYILFRCLTGIATEIPDPAICRKMIAAMVRCVEAIEATAPGMAKDRALVAAESAFDRFLPAGPK